MPELGYFDQCQVSEAQQCKSNVTYDFFLGPTCRAPGCLCLQESAAVVEESSSDDMGNDWEKHTASQPRPQFICSQ